MGGMGGMGMGMGGMGMGGMGMPGMGMGGMGGMGGPMGGKGMQAPMQQRPMGMPGQQMGARPGIMQKQLMGEKIFPLIARMQPEMAGKITGMMLEMDNSELLILLEAPDQLKMKVDEALRVLEGGGR